MRAGVTLADPARVDIRGEVEVGPDSSLDVNVVLEGQVVLGSNVRVGPNCVIRNSRIGDGCVIEANSHIDGAVVAEACQIGPFARVRPGTELSARAKIGNFVETKQAKLGVGSKVNHLTYLGDAEVEEEVNVGAGTITCNYDGVNKFRTVIRRGAFIGSNSSLVAPVEIGANATVGAGSIITTDVPADTLAVGRARQRNVEGWKRPARKSSEKDG